MMATTIYGFMAVYLILRTPSRSWRFFIVTTAILLVFSVALSRIYLGAHYLSDVLAAMAAGIAWVALCLTTVETLRRHRGRFPAASNEL
jgi:undecaprenyl-diphosphatase